MYKWTTRCHSLSIFFISPSQPLKGEPLGMEKTQDQPILRHCRWVAKFWAKSFTYLQCWPIETPYVKEVTLSEQLPPLKCCLPHELLTQFKKGLDISLLKIGVCRSKGYKVTSHQTLWMIRLRPESNPGRLLLVGPGPAGRLFLETSNFDS